MNRMIAAGVVAAASGSAWGQYCNTVDLVPDGMINIIDVIALYEYWISQDLAGDFNDDGIVNGVDLGYQLSHLYTDEDECLALPVAVDSGSVEVVDVTDEVDLDPGLRAYDVKIEWAGAEDIVVSVLDATLGCDADGCFVGPPFGSYLTIGDEPNFNPDPNYDMDAFLAGMSLGENAGWWALPEEPFRGLVGDDFRVTIARFVMPQGQAINGQVSYMIYHPDDPVMPLTVHTNEVNVPGDSCYADFNNDGKLDILDFVAYQNAFTAGDPRADCNGCGCLDILQFICFQNLFVEGCYE